MLLNPNLAKCSEVPSAGCRPFSSIKQEDLSQAQQEEHGTQHHHALFEFHLNTNQSWPSRPTLCVSPGAIPPHPWCMASATPCHLPRQTNAFKGCELCCLFSVATIWSEWESPEGRETNVREGWEDMEGMWERKNVLSIICREKTDWFATPLASFRLEAEADPVLQHRWSLSCICNYIGMTVWFVLTCVCTFTSAQQDITCSVLKCTRQQSLLAITTS